MTRSTAHAKKKKKKKHLLLISQLTNQRSMLGFTCRGARVFPALGGWILLFATTIRIGFPDCVSVMMTGQRREIPWFWSYYDSIANYPEYSGSQIGCVSYRTLSIRPRYLNQSSILKRHVPYQRFFNLFAFVE